MSDEAARAESLTELERQVVNLCADGVKVAGLPKSIGEIFGLLLISPRPLAIDDLVERIRISKGSASQGLRALRALGAIHEVEGVDARRTYFEANTSPKRLVGGFIREEVLPHLQSGESKLREINELAEREADPVLRDFYSSRATLMRRWVKQARLLLPLLQKVLGE